MMTYLVSVAALVGSGIVAGVLFAIALSIVPALFAMPVERYVYTHQQVGRRWDPTMPAIVLMSMVADLVLVLLAPPPASVLFALAAILLLGVALVSHFRNVPINRVVKALDPEKVPAGWPDPRPLWRRWHLVRTALALLGLTANSVAVVVG